MSYLDTLEKRGQVTVPDGNGDIREIRVFLVREDPIFSDRERATLSMGDVRLLVQAEVNDVLVHKLHPEFGIEWDAPDGVIYKAIMNERARAAAEIQHAPKKGRNKW